MAHNPGIAGRQLGRILIHVKLKLGLDLHVVMEKKPRQVYVGIVEKSGVSE